MPITDVNQLTPERKAEWEAARSRGERDNLLVLWDLEDKANATPAAAPSSEAGENTAENNNVQPEEPKQPEVSAPVETQTQNLDQEQPVQGIDYWMKLAESKAKEAESWKKRKGDADRYLEPIQQENAKLHKENSALSEKMDKLEALIEKLTAAQAPKKPDVFLDPNDEFNQNYGEIAERLELIRGDFRKEVEREIAPLKEKLSLQERLTEEEREKARVMTHYAAVKAKVADIDDLFSPTKYGPALAEWAKTQAPIVGSILTKPHMYHEDDVADALTRFKRETGLFKQAKSPAAADIAARINSHTSVAPPPPPDDVFGADFTEKDLNYQIGAINRRVYDSADPIRNNELKMKAMDDFITKAERTLTSRNK